jgi:outer membrane protein assembly factor BamB
MRSRWVRIAVAVVVTLAIAGGLAAWLWSGSKPHSIVGASTQLPTTTTPVVRPRPRPKPTAEEVAVPWPTYGYDAQRTRFAADSLLRPPFGKAWLFRARSLVEFPPVIAYGNLYFPIERGLVIALNAKTGKQVWKTAYHACIAASPTVWRHVVYVAMLNPCNQSHDGQPGLVVALAAKTGKEIWRRTIGASESSPIVVRGILYVGSRDDKLYAFDARTGRLRWSYTAGGEIKGAPAYAAHKIFFGAYDGYVYALDARTGRLVWKSGAENTLVRGRGRFYANPAIAYGRLFIGGTDGVEYAFAVGTGSLLWARATGSYVYGSAAIWNGTVYVGSYDHRFYALDAATGEVRWSFDANGPISGSATVMDGVVYFSTLANRTYGLTARTGKQVWSFPDGQYSPLVAERHLAFLVGHARIYALAPLKR